MWVRSKLAAIQWLQLIEISAGATLSILFAEMLGLRYGSAAGIITLLTIQQTRGKTLNTAVKRMLSFVLMVMLSYATMGLLGFHTAVFGLFLLLYVGASFALEWVPVMSSNAVLATHFLLEKSMAWPLVFNELGLLAIGAAVGVVLNLVLPYRRRPLQHYRDQVEDKFRTILRVMARRILGECLAEGQVTACTPQLRTKEDEQIRQDFAELEARLSRYESLAAEESENRLLSGSSYPQAYFQMRSQQLLLLKRMWDSLERVDAGYEMNHLLSALFQTTADTFAEKNNAEQLLLLHAQIEQAYEQTILPRDRQEFRNRALLYAMLMDIRSFLVVKRSFIDSSKFSDSQHSW